MARTKRKGLVVGNLERVSSKVFDFYHNQIAELVRKHHGVYALYKKDKLYYVGLATNLRRRVKHHLRDRHAKKWDSFSLYLIRNVNYLRELESLLVHIAEPKGNIVHGSFAGSENLIDYLEDLMERRDRALREEILSTKGPVKRKRLVHKRAKHVRGKLASKSVGKAPVLKGLVASPTPLVAHFKGKEVRAELSVDGKIRVGERIFDSPSSAAVHVTGTSRNGLRFWRYQNAEGKWVKLNALRGK